MAQWETPRTDWVSMFKRRNQGRRRKKRNGEDEEGKKKEKRKSCHFLFLGVKVLRSRDQV